jgi:hypothetical protein
MRAMAANTDKTAQAQQNFEEVTAAPGEARVAVPASPGISGDRSEDDGDDDRLHQKRRQQDCLTAAARAWWDRIQSAIKGPTLEDAGVWLQSRL